MVQYHQHGAILLTWCNSTNMVHGEILSHIDTLKHVLKFFNFYFQKFSFIIGELVSTFECSNSNIQNVSELLSPNLLSYQILLKV